ncbi:deoxyribonuclease gamma [Microcaecilia unicolor]|uniref:Deoxyribonuclease gamma n=1 Tax=Microcaecilia unicolor TaxID=1415580 RepID=A0A6P7Y4J2_9AMPH|nr:deoxyribonuclease gamma [Microcaecilia unicolor]
MTGVALKHTQIAYWLLTPKLFKMLHVAFLLLLYFNEAVAIKICSFNVQSFGEAKITKPEVVEVIVKVISRCDIMLLMEIKDSNNKAFLFLLSKLNSHAGGANEYNAIISQRLGRNTYKEQYAFIYRKKMVAVKQTYQYLDLQPGDEDAFSREPYVVWFKCPKTAVKEFVIIPLHTTPEASVREIDELYDVYLDVKQKWKTSNIIFIGDFNADCGYVPKKQWKNIRLRAQQDFVWLIGDNNDTTVRTTTNCAYDRIVVHGEKLLNSIVPDSTAIFNFKEAFGLSEVQALAVSDHFPVEVKLKTTRGFLDWLKSIVPKKDSTLGHHGGSIHLLFSATAKIKT